MKQYVIIIPLILVAACSSAPRPVANSTQTGPNANSQSKEVKSVIAHSSEGQQPSGVSAAQGGNTNGAPGKWSRSGDPIDTSSYDANIETLEEDHRTRPTDGTKKALAQAYFERGFALTEARQYASALGDYRRALKFDSNHEESKKWIAQIESIYSAIKKDAPKAGQEPPPLPLKKES